MSRFDRRQALLSMVALAVHHVAAAEAAVDSKGAEWAVKRVWLRGDWRNTRLHSVMAVGNGTKNGDFWRSVRAINGLGTPNASFSQLKYAEAYCMYYFDLYLKVEDTDSDHVAATCRYVRPHKHGAGRYGVFAIAFQFPDT